MDPVGSPELFTTVLDMLTVLIHTALAAEPATCGQDKLEEKKIYGNLVKKIRKEIGEKLTAGVEHLKLLLPLAKKSLDIIAVEPAGSVLDPKGNKIAGFDSTDRKHGLQVGSQNSNES